MTENSEILKKRIKQLRKSSQSGKSVLYVMSRDQRVADNHALLAAQKHALAKKLPLAVVFCLRPGSSKRAQEHYRFMLEGLEEVEKSLHHLNIPFMMLIGDPHERLAGAFHHLQPDAAYFDFNPLRGPKKLAEFFASNNHTDMSMYVVDTHNCVPVWQVSDKLEVGAYTLRPKIHKLINEYLVEPELMIKHPYDWSGRIQTMKELEPMVNELLSEIAANGTNIQLKSGESAAKKRLEDFIAYRLDMYGLHRNDPSLDSQSDFSPYLHFGQISSLRIALRLREEALRINSDLHITHSSKIPKPDETVAKLYSINALIEEMIVRKELADNFCFYTDTYDSLDSAPGWARASLDKHRRDSRPFLYSYEQLEKAQTHDPAWNACQTQMRKTGKMHGYMRMYWAKKILEWTESPDQAIDFLVRLNDFYSVDGGDPSGYAGILWSVGGVHDRPWQEREVFGVIRYMNYAGLKRKFAIEAYQNKWLDDTAGKTATLNI